MCVECARFTHFRSQDTLLQESRIFVEGNPNLKHFNQDKQKFSAYAVLYNENNRALEEFYQIYWKLIQNHPELDAKQIANYY